MEEIFKDVVGYEGLYQVSNLGNVKSLPRERCNLNGCWMTKEKILKPAPTNGYFGVGLWIDGINKSRRIHQLVAEAFLNHTPCGFDLVVDHINNDKLDNRLENLQLITCRENNSKDKISASKYTGVSQKKNEIKWTSQIQINDKYIHIGTFKCELAASVAYQKALEDFNNGKEIQRHLASYSSQYKGVSFLKSTNKWTSYIILDKKQYYLGSFEKEYDAHIAYQKAAADFNNGKEIQFKTRSSSSKYKGVCWSKQHKKWKSQITINKKKCFLGYFEKEYEASVAYQNKLLSLNN